MGTLTIIPYAPKPPKRTIREPVSKSIARQLSSRDTSFQINSNDVPIEVPLAVGRAADDNHWYQKGFGDDLAGIRGTYFDRARSSPLPLFNAI
jgi:hypothetical protein